jgi:hypothetical protein
VRKHGVFCPFLKSSPEEWAVGAFSASMALAASRALQARQSSWQRPRRLPLGCERTLAWLRRFRRLALRYERRADVHEAFLALGCALITWRYLKREF